MPDVLPCVFCGETGRRDDMGGAECDWCGGTGRVPRWDRQEASNEGPMSARDLLVLCPEGFTPGVCVTPEGRMFGYGWRDPSKDEEERAQCAEDVRVLLSRHPDCVVGLSHLAGC